MTVTGKWTCAALAAVLVCTGCATQQPARHMVRAQSDTRAITLHAGQLTLQQEMTLDHLCPFGHPRHRQGWEHGFTELVVRDGYGLEHSGDYKIPLWVCERMDPARLDGPFQRKDSFKADPVLTGPRSELRDYKGSAYHRGHHAPAEDFTDNKQQMSESFYLSNMSPQTPSLNSGAWAQLEARVRRWVAEDRVTWIITGALIYDPAEETDDADGWIEYYTIGAGVAVPTHLYKIVVGQDANGELSATAYVVPNEKLPAGYDLAAAVQVSDAGEERAGLDFMPELEPGDSQTLEAGVAAARSP